MEIAIYGPNDKVVKTVSTIGYPTNPRKSTEKLKSEKLVEKSEKTKRS